MNKRPILALSVTALLLAGCATAESTASGQAQAPSASPSPEVTSQEPTPSPTPTPAPVPTPTATAVPEPTEEPPAPAPASVAPQPAAPVEPPAAQPAVKVYPDLVPVAEWDAVRVERAAGTSWNVVGDGYTPGAEIFITFGPMSTDANLLDEPIAYADANGHYTVAITLPADLKPGSYGIMTVDLPNRERNKRFASVQVVAP